MAISSLLWLLLVITILDHVPLCFMKCEHKPGSRVPAANVLAREVFAVSSTFLAAGLGGGAPPLAPKKLRISGIVTLRPDTLMCCRVGDMRSFVLDTLAWVLPQY